MLYDRKDEAGDVSSNLGWTMTMYPRVAFERIPPPPLVSTYHEARWLIQINIILLCIQRYSLPTSYILPLFRYVLWLYCSLPSTRLPPSLLSLDTLLSHRLSLSLSLPPSRRFLRKINPFGPLLLRPRNPCETSPFDE